MVLFFYVGCALLIIAFLSAVLELMAGVQVHWQGVFMSAYDLWYVKWPGSLVKTQIMFDKNLPAVLWDPLLVSLLALPAWLLIGAPGAFLLIKYRPARGDIDELEEESLYVLDELSARARNEGYDTSGEDMYSEHDIDFGDGSRDDYTDEHGVRQPGDVPDDWSRPEFPPPPKGVFKPKD